jgi:hypothetical protein
VERRRRSSDQHKDRREDQNSGKRFCGHLSHPYHVQDDISSEKLQTNFVPPHRERKKREKDFNYGRKALRAAPTTRETVQIAV